jgi:hypothetical protein
VFPCYITSLATDRKIELFLSAVNCKNDFHGCSEVFFFWINRSAVLKYDDEVKLIFSHNIV